MAIKNRTFVAVVIANVAVLVVLAVYMPYPMFSPGKLIDAHAELASDCFGCHTPFLGSRPAKCIQCHKVAEIGIKTTTGLSISREKKNVAFHQKLTEDDCIECHSDHRGVQAFRPIGQFSHQLIESVVRRQCDGCHSRPGDALHRKIKGNCSECHTEQGWLPATFDHEQYFRFDKHHTADCETCHIDSDYSSYTCYGCHEHSRSEIREEHVEEGIYDYEDCVECHRSGDEEAAERLWRKKRMRQGETEKDGRRSYRREHDDD